MQRSLLIFLESVRSEASRKQYQYYLDKFMKFHSLESYDDLAGLDEDKLQMMVEDFVISLKQRVSPNSVPTFIYPLRSFFDANEKELKWKKIKKMFPAPIKKTGRQHHTTQDIQKMLESTKEIRNKALIHFLASTGCRIGAVPDLKIRNLTRMRDGFIAVTFYEDTRDEYQSFLTPEASEVLDRYFAKRRNDGEELTSTSPVFRASYTIKGQKIRPIAPRASESVVLRALRAAGLRTPDDKIRGRFGKQTNHGFRKRFITALKSNEKIPVAYAERLAGHMVYSDEHGNRITLDDSYLRPQLEKLLSFFELAVHELTIDERQRLKAENELQQKRVTVLEETKSELEKKNSKLEDALHKVDELWSDKQRMEHFSQNRK